MKNKRGRPKNQVKASLTSVRRDREQLKLDRERGELLPRANVERIWKGVLIGLRQAINGLDMPLAYKAKVLKELSEIPVEKYL